MLSTPTVRMKCLNLQKAKAACIFSQTLRGPEVHCLSHVEICVVHPAEEPWQVEGFAESQLVAVSCSSLLHQSGYRDI